MKQIMMSGRERFVCLWVLVMIFTFLQSAEAQQCKTICDSDGFCQSDCSSNMPQIPSAKGSRNYELESSIAEEATEPNNLSVPQSNRSVIPLTPPPLVTCSTTLFNCTFASNGQPYEIGGSCWCNGVSGYIHSGVIVR